MIVFGAKIQSLSLALSFSFVPFLRLCSTTRVCSIRLTLTLFSLFCSAVVRFAQGSSSSPSWSSLVSRELSLSASSRELSELDGFRTSLVGQHSFDGEIERAFTKLSALVAKRATQQSKNLNRIRSIFSEQQFIKYIEWSHRRQHNGTAAQQHKPQMAAAAPAAAAASGYETHPQLGDFEFVPVKLE